MTDEPKPLISFDIRQAWDAVEPGLRWMKTHLKPDWRPEDLYAACIAKRAFLFMPDPAQSDFVVLTQQVCVYSGNPHLNVLVAYSKMGNATAIYQSEIDRIGREAGCTHVEFASPRRGWEKLAQALGYMRRLTVYRRAL